MNRLDSATSPYLRSAAHQPIHWYPWGAEPFAAARASDRPVLLDIGAVWCHWCHVMDGESYEDPALGEWLNQHFVCVKVDRDERPDVDARYQRAVQAVSGQGGWPLTAFLLPDGEVFFGGTYFPPDGRYGRPGFRSVLEQVLEAYRARRDRVTDQARAIRRVVTSHLDETSAAPLGLELLELAADQMAAIHDPVNGGFGTQPKFPHPGAILFLLARWQDGGDPGVRQIVERTLLGMARGGIHDQLAGGFHRYSVDARWIVPHFEKMSYDNAELLRAYAEAGVALGLDELRTTAVGIIEFVRQVLAHSDGGYGASQDADVGLEDDGDYFTWSRAEVEAALEPAELEVVASYYDIGTAGEMQHDPSRNVLFVAEPLDRIAGRLGIPPAEAEAALGRARQKLLAVRSSRPTPAVDRTRYTSWNGMMAGALIRAAGFLDQTWPLEHGLRTLGLIRRESTDPTRLLHSPGGVGGLLDDQVQVAEAAIEAYEATGDRSWLEWSEGLLDRVWEEYDDDASGGLFDSSGRAGSEGLLGTRLKPVEDAPTASPNGVAALAAARLFELTGRPRWAERRDRLLTTFAGRAAEVGLYLATLLRAADWALNPATHLVIVDAGDPDAEIMHRLARRAAFPRRVIHRVRSDGMSAEGLPAAVGAMLGVATGTRGYLCIGPSCQAPVSDAGAWDALLRSVRRQP